MPWVYKGMFPAIWMSYLVYWWALSGQVKESERTEPGASRLARLATILVALALLCLPKFPFSQLNRRFLPLEPWTFWAGAILTAAGLLFSVWARYHLGRNWSRAVTLKKDHELITSGPYAWVRHPIYTGLLFGLLGSAVARGEWRGLVAVLLMVVVLWRKLSLEEKWLSARFGQQYDDYRDRVPALVPFVV